MPGEEVRFLHSLPIRRVWMGVTMRIMTRRLLHHRMLGQVHKLFWIISSDIHGKGGLPKAAYLCPVPFAPYMMVLTLKPAMTSSSAFSPNFAQTSACVDLHKFRPIGTVESAPYKIVSGWVLNWFSRPQVGVLGQRLQVAAM